MGCLLTFMSKIFTPESTRIPQARVIGWSYCCANRVEIIPKFDFFVVICDEIVAKYTHKLVRITGRPYIEPDQNMFNRYVVGSGASVSVWPHKYIITSSGRWFWWSHWTSPSHWCSGTQTNSLYYPPDLLYHRLQWRALWNQRVVLCSCNNCHWTRTARRHWQIPYKGKNT